MLRAIGGVIAGYVVMFVFVFATFTVAYLIMGTEGAFKEGSYEVSPLWLGTSAVLGVIAAIAGGLVCAMIAGGGKAPMVLAGVVLVLGVAMALPVVMAPDDETPAVRTGDVGNLEAMSKATQPAWLVLANPVIGAIGVMIGAGMRRKGGKGDEQSMA